MLLMRVLASWCLLAALVACDDDSSAAPRPTTKGSCNGVMWEEWADAYDSLGVLLLTDHFLELTATAVSGHDGDTQGYVSARVQDDFYSRPGAPALPDHLQLSVFSCQVGTIWVPGHRYLVPVVRLSNGEWLPVGHNGMLGYDAGMIDTLDRRKVDLSWADQLVGRTSGILAQRLDAAHASYRKLLHYAWQQPEPQNRFLSYPSTRREPVPKAEREIEAGLRAAHPGLQITWLRRVVRHDVTADRIGSVTMAEGADRSTWSSELVAHSELYRARIGDREVWVARLPRFAGADRTLLLAFAPDGWSVHAFVGQA